MGIDNEHEFTELVRSFARTLAPGPLLLFRKKITLLILDGVVKTTPVKTGRARGNWQVSESDAPTGEVPEERWDKKGGRVLQEEGMKADRQIVDPFGITWIVNNVPYAERLEHGWSRRRAPRGMMGITLRRMNTMLNRGLAASEVGL